MHRKSLALAAICSGWLFLLAGGCGAAGDATYESVQSRSPASKRPSDQRAAEFEPAAADTPAEADQAAADAAARRRIIYTGSITLVVKDFAEAAREVDRLLRQANGFVASFGEDRTYGDQRSGRWVVRVPVPAFHGFMDDLSHLGVAELQNIDGQDVTEEFVDLEARLKNQRVLEERVLKLLDDRSGDIKDIIAVEEQLARVRGEIERMEGRLRYLADRTELTTVTIVMREDKSYVPPAPPTLASRVSQSWMLSLTSLRQAGENLLVFLVGAAPWLLVLLLIAAPLVWLIRRRLRAAPAAG